MVQKLTMACSACFLGFAGVFAFDAEWDGGTTELPPVEATMAVDSLMTPALSPLEEALLHPKRFAPLPPEKIDSETLWLARCIFSETKRPDEQVLVAWVIRNRVETHYRGKGNYRDVVLDPFQFSAFAPNNEKRAFYVGLGPASTVPGWQKALSIAHTVRALDTAYRPFAVETRHFFSERSMPDRLAPDWADGLAPVELREPFEILPERFRFFAGIS
jgi:hypothetical protein